MSKELERLLLSLPNCAVRRAWMPDGMTPIEGAYFVVKGNPETGGVDYIAQCLSEEAACAVLRLQCIR